MISVSYPRSWRATILGEVVDLISGQHIDAAKCNVEGLGTPYLTGPSDFYGDGINCTKFTEFPQVCCQAGDILLTVKGSGTGSIAVADDVYCISRQLMAVRPKNSDSAFIRFVLESREKDYNQASAGLIPGITREDVLSTKLGLPPLNEQQVIGKALSDWCTALQTTTHLLSAKEKLLRHLRDRFLLHPAGSRRVRLRDVTRESAARNGSRLGRDAVMAVTKQAGMRPMREETIAASIGRYKVVRPGAFAYNPMRLNIGSIAVSPFSSDVLVSPDYVVFECDESRLLPGYLNHLRFSSHWGGHFGSAGNGSVRVRIYYDDLGAFSFALPPLEEQGRIVRALDAAAAEIELLARYGASLQTQKRALMQQLLTGRRRLGGAVEVSP